MKLFITSLMLFLSVASAFAQKENTSLLLLTSNNAPSESHKRGEIILVLNDDGSVKTLIKKQMHKETGEVLQNQRFKLETLLSGAVLEKKKGRDIIILKAKGFNLNGVNELKLSYLYNGITGSYKSQKLFAKRVKGEWQVFDGQGEQIHELHIKSNNMFLLGSIGIDRIQYNDEEEKL